MEDAGDDLFMEQYAERRSELARLARTQRVPGMEQDDVHAELSLCLWRACQTYDPASNVKLGQWWWAIWMNRKANLIEAYFRLRRVHPTPMTPDKVVDLVDALSPALTHKDMRVPHCPSLDQIERSVWLLLSLGYQRTQVQRMLNIRKRQIYGIIHSWRTPEVLALLT